MFSSRHCASHFILFAPLAVLGCSSAGSQATSNGAALGAVDLLMAGEKVTDQYSIHVTACRHDTTSHQLIFSGKKMASFAWKTQDALRIPDTGTSSITAYRKGQPLVFNASSCRNQPAGGEVNLDCRQSGNHLSATIHYGSCGAK